MFLWAVVIHEQTKITMLPAVAVAIKKCGRLTNKASPLHCFILFLVSLQGSELTPSQGGRQYHHWKDVHLSMEQSDGKTGAQQRVEPQILAFPVFVSFQYHPIPSFYVFLKLFGSWPMPPSTWEFWVFVQQGLANCFRLFLDLNRLFLQDLQSTTADSKIINFPLNPLKMW